MGTNSDWAQSDRAGAGSGHALPAGNRRAAPQIGRSAAGGEGSSPAPRAAQPSDGLRAGASSLPRESFPRDWSAAVSSPSRVDAPVSPVCVCVGLLSLANGLFVRKASASASVLWEKTGGELLVIYPGRSRSRRGGGSLDLFIYYCSR